MRILDQHLQDQLWSSYQRSTSSSSSSSRPSRMTNGHAGPKTSFTDQQDFGTAQPAGFSEINEQAQLDFWNGDAKQFEKDGLRAQLYENNNGTTGSTKKKGIFDNITGNFNESKSTTTGDNYTTNNQKMKDYFAGSKSNGFFSSGKAGAYKPKIQEQTGPDVLVKGTEIGTRTEGGLQFTYKNNDALMDFLTSSPADLATDSVKDLQKFFLDFENQVNQNMNRDKIYRNKIDIGKMVGGTLMDQTSGLTHKNPRQAMMKMVTDLGPDVIKKTKTTMRFYKDFGLYAVQKVGEVINMMSPVTVTTEPAPNDDQVAETDVMGEKALDEEELNGVKVPPAPDEVQALDENGKPYTMKIPSPLDNDSQVKVELKGGFKDIADALSGPMKRIKEELRSMKETAADGLKYLLGAAKGWMIQPGALAAWPAYFMLSAYRAYAKPRTRMAASWKLGAKIMVDFMTPSIRQTDLFDIKKWNCKKFGAMGKVEKAGNQLENLARSALGQSISAEKGTMTPKGILAFHPSITFRNPQNLVHVHLQESNALDPATNNPDPCKIYWDALYDLKGEKVLKSDQVAIGGEWPWFFHVCKEKLATPKRFTQLVTYLNPSEQENLSVGLDEQGYLNNNRNPMQQKLQDVVCDGQQCFIDGDLHPIREEPVADLKCPGAEDPGPHALAAAEKCYFNNPKYACKEGKQFKRFYVDLKNLDAGDRAEAHDLEDLEAKKEEKQDSELGGDSQAAELMTVRSYDAGECKLKSVIYDEENVYYGWCNKKSLEKKAKTFTLRITNGAEENLIGSAQATLYDRGTLGNSFQFALNESAGRTKFL
ncbi:unnamed protein product [Amoebophrya sp. A120]|nr:unnamed protein product [Amoebophrya sp. A120]|eukprot:GSA120T00024518001.1